MAAKKRSKSKAKTTGSASGGAKGSQSLAKQADKFALYEESVQDPERDYKLSRRIFNSHFGRAPTTLREDFCGTAALACYWVDQHPSNQAWGVDLDPEPLKSGRERHVSALSEDAQSRLELIEGDVRGIRHESVDITVALNFSYFGLRERADLLAYFRSARETLLPEGILLLDAYGGPEAQQTLEETTEYDTFDYVWDQDEFDPIHNAALNYIHFEFPDGSTLRKAFSYEWRLWSIPELADLLSEAGFGKTEVYWEGVDEDTDEGNGVFRKAETALDDPAWVAYIAAVR